MKTTPFFLLTVCLFLCSSPAWSASTKQEVLELQEQVAEIKKDLEEIKTLLKEGARAPAAPARAPAGFKEQEARIGPSPVKGDTNATVTMIEYSDYQCPFCARHYREVMPTLQRDYIDTGKLKFVMRENPIPSLHRNATNASIAALCAGNQEQYWGMHDLIFDNQKELDLANLKKLASTLDLDTNQFNDCLDNKKTETQVNRDVASGTRLGMRGTPGFFLGLTDQEDPDKVNLTVFIRGAQSLAQFKSAIDELLESAE